ncbi:uncharacterized protein VTP21DRAFT_5787 [Calcarisporiella thermophila]|uniref:uncharacterized protein n=1 Tax=Calcarisporiella thermophila TaxID=911321 RepID=UPI003743B0DA
MTQGGKKLIKLITFDAFGTLFKPRGSIGAQYASEAQRRGIPLSKESVKKSFSHAIRHQVQHYPNYGSKQGGKMTSKEWWRQVVKRTFVDAGASPKALEPVFDEMFTTLYERFASAEGYDLFEDSVPVLAELHRRKFKIGVVSNSDERISQVLASLNLTQYLDFIVLSCEFGDEKPSRRIFEHALQLAGVRGHNSLHVGDDIDKDFGGARNAGMNALLIHRQTEDPPLANGDLQNDERPIVIQNLYQVLEYLPDSPPA